MILKTNIAEALRSLTSTKQRTILALIGIVIGIGSVIGMVSIGAIVENEALKQFQDMGVDIATVRKAGYDKSTEITLKDIYDLQKHVPSVLEVAPYITTESDFGTGDKKLDLVQMGVTQSFFDLNKIRVTEGRFITDLDQYRYFCVVGGDTSKYLKGQGTTKVIGSQIVLGSRIFTIVGIIDKVPDGGLRPYGINSSAIMHITTAGRSFQNSTLSNFMVRLDDKTSSADTKEAIKEYFVKTASGLQVNVDTAEELIENMKKQMQLFSILLGAIGSIALIVGGIGVMNVMLISVTERRREIGLRRALGAQQKDIQAQFITESVTLCLFGGIIGIILGIIVSYIFSLISKWDFLISYGSIVLGFCVATAVGIFFGFYPARAAARLDPIRALRS
jgi:putative ABC transport system permease protein